MDAFNIQKHQMYFQKKIELLFNTLCLALEHTKGYKQQSCNFKMFDLIHQVHHNIPYLSRKKDFPNLTPFQQGAKI